MCLSVPHSSHNLGGMRVEHDYVEILYTLVSDFLLAAPPPLAMVLGSSSASVSASSNWGMYILTSSL